MEEVEHEYLVRAHELGAPVPVASLKLPSKAMTLRQWIAVVKHVLYVVDPQLPSPPDTTDTQSKEFKAWVKRTFSRLDLLHKADFSKPKKIAILIGGLLEVAKERNVSRASASGGEVGVQEPPKEVKQTLTSVNNVPKKSESQSTAAPLTRSKSKTTSQASKPIVDNPFKTRSRLMHSPLHGTKGKFFDSQNQELEVESSAEIEENEEYYENENIPVEERISSQANSENNSVFEENLEQIDLENPQEESVMVEKEDPNEGNVPEHREEESLKEDIEIITSVKEDEVAPEHIAEESIVEGMEKVEVKDRAGAEEDDEFEFLNIQEIPDLAINPLDKETVNVLVRRVQNYISRFRNQYE
jgi:hypothetical protein